jgi:hypothetical protein
VGVRDERVGDTVGARERAFPIGKPLTHYVQGVQTPGPILSQPLRLGCTSNRTFLFPKPLKQVSSGERTFPTHLPCRLRAVGKVPNVVYLID